MKILKMHIGLIKYIIQEFRKKKNLREHVIFFKKLSIQYFKVNLQEYKKLFLIFDIDYQTQKKQYKKYNQLKFDLQRAIKLLQYIDNKMEKSGINRQRRRQFWRDFFSRGEVRKETFEELMKELEG